MSASTGACRYRLYLYITDNTGVCKLCNIVITTTIRPTSCSSQSIVVVEGLIALVIHSVITDNLYGLAFCTVTNAKSKVAGKIAQKLVMGRSK